MYEEVSLWFPKCDCLLQVRNSAQGNVLARAPVQTEHFAVYLQASVVQKVDKMDLAAGKITIY